MTAVTPLLYSVSTGSAFSAYKKLHGASNYHEWRVSTCTLLHALCQWVVITGTATTPTPIDPMNPTPDKLAAQEAWHVRSWSLYIEITYWVDTSIKTVISDLEDPKLIWELLEWRYGARQHGLQALLQAKLNQMRWDGEGSIVGHHNTMVALRSKMAAAGLSITDNQFYKHFLDSLPWKLDFFVTMYNDPQANVNTLCDRFTKYKMRLKVASICEGKMGEASGSDMALTGQSASSTKGKGKAKKRDLTDVTCYRCGKKGHLKRKCPDKLKGDDAKDEKKDDKPKSDKGKEAAEKLKVSSSMLYTTVSILETESTNTYIRKHRI